MEKIMIGEMIKIFLLNDDRNRQFNVLQLSFQIGSTSVCAGMTDNGFWGSRCQDDAPLKHPMPRVSSTMLANIQKDQAETQIKQGYNFIGRSGINLFKFKL